MFYKNVTIERVQSAVENTEIYKWEKRDTWTSGWFNDYVHAVTGRIRLETVCEQQD